MYNIISLVIILVSASIVVYIVAKKFSVLANVDVENIPAEKEALAKERIISHRLKRHFVKFSSRFLRMANTSGHLAKNFFTLLYNKLHQIKEEYTEKNTPSKKEGEESGAGGLVREAELLAREDKFEEAEKKLIEAISENSKNIQAFKMLADIYSKLKNFQEARQTFEHILKLQDSGDISALYQKAGDKPNGKKEAECERGKIYFELALTEKELGNLEAAAKTLKEALKIEPKNPRYLDTMIDISIILKDKVSALDAYEKLNEINPENGKLEEFKNQIREL